MYKSKSTDCLYTKASSLSIWEKSKDDWGSSERLGMLGEEAEELLQPATGAPEVAFNVVFAGNASVGKTSFIYRVVKDRFVSHLGATLGVDYQMKTYQMNARNVALQLWDTAGQER